MQLASIVSDTQKYIVITITLMLALQTHPYASPLSWLPEPPSTKPPITKKDFWAAQSYKAATDLDSDHLLISAKSSQTSLGWQTQWNSIHIATEGQSQQTSSHIGYQDNDLKTEIKEKTQTNHGQVTLKHPIGGTSLKFFETQSDRHSYQALNYDIYSSVTEWLDLGVFSESDAQYRTILDTRDTSNTRYDVNYVVKEIGTMVDIQIAEISSTYKNSSVSLQPINTTGGQFHLLGNGQRHQISLQGPLTNHLQGTFTIDHTELSGKGKLYSHDQTLHATLKWEDGFSRRLYLGIKGEAPFYWTLGIEAQEIQIKNLLLQSVNDWLSTYDNVVGRKHFKNDQTAFQLQQLSASWRTPNGFSGSIALGKLSFLGQYKEYETPLFFTYYVDTHTADIAELDYLSIQLRQSWEITSALFFHIEGRQFLPFRIVKAETKNTPSGENDSPPASPTNSEINSSLKWSGYTLETGITYFF